MKIAISYPPLESKRGVPLLAQNRQFQWFKEPTYIYPMVPASAATLLKENGYEVFWDDGIAEELTYQQWLERIKKQKPDIIAIETKTPIVKRHWQIINELKSLKIENWKLEIVLMGDHVSALPEESLRNSSVDYVLTGGDYDFMLLNLANHLTKGEELQPGWYFRSENGKVENTGHFQLNHNLDDLPFIDRDLTRWQLYAYKNGNYKYLPGTYTMHGRDCWWGRCSFCSWTTLFPGKNYRARSVEKALDEIKILIEKYRVREIFDDSGCFPRGEWLEQFCNGLIERGYHKKVVLGCNMRVGELNQKQWSLMKKANFRFILIGLESVSQNTLNRLNKGIRVAQIEETIKMVKKAGLEPHITTMVGYPWETREDAEATINFARRLFKKGYIDTLQATIVVPYPGTPMFAEAKKNSWLLTEDWDDYDMKQSVWKSPIDNTDVLKFTQGLYKAAINPLFIIRKIISIRKLDDIKFLLRAVKKFMGHIVDFGK